MLSTFTTGLVTGLALIIAIGAQNAFVLRQGIRREGLWLVVAICALSDVVLIAAGTAGMNTLLASVPWLVDVMRWAGVAYLLWFAYRSARSAMRPGTLEPADAPDGAEAGGGSARSRLRGIALTTLALTWLNPHVYLDTVIMLGTVANQFGDARWVFAGGAMTASILWFTLFGLGARALAPLLRTPTTWRVVDAVVAVVMVAVALRLAFMG